VIDEKIIPNYQQKAADLFHFLSQLSQLKTPQQYSFSPEPWSFYWEQLPIHHLVEQAKVISPQTEGTEHSILEPLLTVTRPTAVTCPKHPEILTTWLLSSRYNEPEILPQFITQREHPAPVQKETSQIDEPNVPSSVIVELFEEDPGRILARERWLRNWHQWAEQIKRDRPVIQLFQSLYKLHGLLEQEGGQLELVWQDGWLLAQTAAGIPIHMPVISLKCQLIFNPQLPSFTLELLEEEVPELNTGLIAQVNDLPHTAIPLLKSALEELGYDPLDRSACDTFLQGLANRLGPEAIYHDKLISERSLASYPQVYSRPLLAVRKRAAGLADTLLQVANNLQQNPMEELSQILIDLVGGRENALNGAGTEADTESTASLASQGLPHLDPQVLFSKPANQEQLDIAHRLAKNGAVLVQGPPGTGKTHTIANLIGHLLAQGKSILITAHTSKALKVVRNKVVPSLQGLCVNVLDSDSESKRQLEASIDTISERLGHINPTAAQREIQQLEERRNQLIESTLKAYARLRTIIQSEYEPIQLCGKIFSPSQAAQLLAQGAGLHDWLPGPISVDLPLPLSMVDLKFLYTSQEQLSLQEEVQLSQKLPKLSQLPVPAIFAQWNQDWHRWQSVPQQPESSNFWQGASTNLKEEDLDSLLQAVEALNSQLSQATLWQKALVQISFQSVDLKNLWHELLASLQPLQEKLGKLQVERIERNPQLAPEHSLEEQINLLDELLVHLKQGQKFGLAERIFKKHWFEYLEQLRCYEKPLNPKNVTVSDIKALQSVANFQKQYKQALLRWDHLMAMIDGPTSESLDSEPLLGMLQYQPQLEQWLTWKEYQWQPLRQKVESAGLDWESVQNAQVVCSNSKTGLVDRLCLALANGLVPQFQAILAQRKITTIQSQLTALSQYLEAFTKSGTPIESLYQLHRAVLDFDQVAYAALYGNLRDLLLQYEVFTQRKALLSSLATVAPDWADKIAHRQPGHNGSVPPGDFQEAWQYRQLSQILEKRHAQSIQDVQHQLETFQRQLISITAELIEQRAWLAQKERVGITQQQALEGWKKIIQKIGKGTGKKVPALRLEAQALMKQCKSAVPVWIMPFSRVVENFPPMPNTFDVIIVDEASQLDLRGLLLFYMAKQIIVVGDDKQVTPDAVGQGSDKETQLQHQWLNGKIPNAILYDGKASIYDRAKEVFGQSIMLKEHFRCVPEIIQYCNTLSYESKIQPLRDPSNVHLKPHWVPIYVAEAYQQGKINPKEAEWTAALITACLNDPAFIHADGRPVTIGMISLFGDDQAVAVDRLLKQNVEPLLLERHAVQCSNAAHFQGDERDVMFLSLRYAPNVEGTPHNRFEFGVGDMYRKRFNVAVSRARDQIWLVHSLRPELDLRTGDIRRNLLEYAFNPQAVNTKMEQLAPKTESPFEQAVLKDLLIAGYQVTPQWVVGSYRLDLVVTSPNGKRVAIECDGEKYHGVDRLADDLARQAQLERLGWEFIRIRGSQYYRNSEQEMARVRNQLTALNIFPGILADDLIPIDTQHELPVRIQAAATDILACWQNNGGLLKTNKVE